MASPFNVFRKHQKVVIVAAGVLCMFVFVIGDVLFQLVPRGGGGGRNGYGFDDVAVRWDGGELTLGQVQNLVGQRNVLRHFLQTAAAMGIQATGQAPQVREVMQLGVREEAPERYAVYRHLMAQAARDAGMVVSDAAINQYLSQLTQGKVSTEELRQIASNLKVNNRPIGMRFLFEALREEMLAETYWNTYLATVTTITPHERWEDWLKFNDRVVIESVAVPVGNFVAEVPDPTDQELREFYEKYKDREPTNEVVEPNTPLPSPEPGFRIPRRAEVHYIEANYENLVRQIAEEVSEEEIREYYEEHKDTFIKPQFDLGETAGADDTSGTDVTGSEDAAAAGADATEPAVEAAEGEQAAQEAEPTVVEEPTTGADDANQPPSEDAADDPGTEEPQSNGPSSTESGAPEADENDAPAPEAEDQSSHLLIPAAEPTQYVAFQQDEQPAEPAAADDGNTASDVGGQADPANPFAEDAAADPAGAAEAQEPAASEVSAPTDREGLPPEPADEAEAADVEYLPLETVEAEIRQTIADDRVPERLREVMPLIYSELARVYREYEDRRLDAEELGRDPADVPAPSYNLQELAEKFGLEAKQTPLLSPLELQETDLGQSLVRDAGLPYWYYAFEQQELYQPVQTGLTVSAFEQALGRFNEYIAVKVEDRPSRTPPLDEIRDEVVRAYKRVQARDLAMAAAEALAKQAREAGTPLAEQFAENEEYEVVESDPFSWYTQSLDQAFRLGSPFGVEIAGPEFMEKVFSLEPGEVAAVWNHDRSVAYVVRLVRHQLSEDALRDLFLREANRSQAVLQATQYRSQQLHQLLLANLIETANVEWVIPPDQSDLQT